MCVMVRVCIVGVCDKVVLCSEMKGSERGSDEIGGSAASEYYKRQLAVHSKYLLAVKPYMPYMPYLPQIPNIPNLLYMPRSC